MQQRLFSNASLVKLIIPLVIEQGLTILVGMADGVMVASVGEAAISGVSLVDMIAAVILVLFAALATGGAVVTSQFLGARELEKARRSAGQLILMATALGILIMLPCLLFAEPLLMLCFGAIEADVKEAGLIYLKITEFNGAKLEIEYEVCDKETGNIHITGHSKHCFVKSDTFRPIRLKKDYPEMAEIFE